MDTNEVVWTQQAEMKSNKRFDGHRCFKKTMERLDNTTAANTNLLLKVMHLLRANRLQCNISKISVASRTCLCLAI